jgi:hypothetical protein
MYIQDTHYIYSCRVRSNPYGHDKRGQKSSQALLLKEQTGVPPVQGSHSVCDNVAFSMCLQVTCDLHVWWHALVCLAKVWLGKLPESATLLDTWNSHIPDALLTRCWSGILIPVPPWSNNWNSHIMMIKLGPLDPIHQYLRKLVSRGFSHWATKETEQKPEKTRKLENLKTYVRFSGNPLRERRYGNPGNPRNLWYYSY